MTRNLYLKTVTLDKALNDYYNVLIKTIDNNKKETINVIDSLNRVCTTPIYAKVSSPLYDCAAMDGICVKSKSTINANETNPIILNKDIDYIEIDTGDPIEYPYDCVIMAEDVITIDENTVKIITSAAPYQHVRPIGEDIVAKEMILPSNHCIRPMDLGVLLSGGISEIEVYKKCDVAIIPTGSEIVELNNNLKKGDIIESNSKMFAGIIIELGANPHCKSIVKDDYDLIKEAIIDAADNHDVIIINAGSSAGREDYTADIIKEIGQVVVHGVAIKPGKPVILGIINNKPIIGIPGYPVSAYIVFENFVNMVISLYTKQNYQKNNTIEATITKRIVSSLRHQEYVRVKVGKVNGKWVATPLNRGAGAAMSLVKANGFLIIPLNSEGYEANETVTISLYHDKSVLEKTLVVIGSHDLILDVIDDMMPTYCKGLRLSSTHVGSMSGLMALKRGECHIAPIHILNEENGIYNEDIIKKVFNKKMAIIKGVKRVQGLIVAKNNPLNIKNIKDIINYRYINRQRGAGTRILLDYLLKEYNIDSNDIEGYEHEASTHMAVAASILNNTADVGMGIYAAAKALDLDFIPIGNEEYDFIVDYENLNDDMIKEFISILKNPSLHSKLEQLGGYSFETSGEVIEIE